MTGRALVFSNEAVISRLKADFVPYAGDKWYLNRQQDADGRFLARLATQRDGAIKRADAPQGVYVATPGGVLLAYDHFQPSAESFLALLNRATAAAQSQAAEPIAGAAENTIRDARFRRDPPPGGRVLNVYTRIALAPTGTAWTPNQATGRDHLWLTADDLRALRPPAWSANRRYPVPPALAARIARFHLTDNVRGEPTFWEHGDVRTCDLFLTVENPAAAHHVRLGGTVRLSSSNNKRTYHARVQGYLAWSNTGDNADEERLVRFDWLAWGEASGEGTYTRGAPSGRFPLVIAACLAPAGDTAAASVPPQGSRERDAYLNPAAR